MMAARSGASTAVAVAVGNSSGSVQVADLLVIAWTSSTVPAMAAPAATPLAADLAMPATAVAATATFETPVAKNAAIGMRSSGMALLSRCWVPVVETSPWLFAAVTWVVADLLIFVGLFLLCPASRRKKAYVPSAAVVWTALVARTLVVASALSFVNSSRRFVAIWRRMNSDRCFAATWRRMVRRVGAAPSRLPVWLPDAQNPPCAV